MPSFTVRTPQSEYSAIVERGVIADTARHLPRKAGTVFVVCNAEVWRLHGLRLQQALEGVRHEMLFLPGGEEQKRLAPLEMLAERMVELGADRSSVVIAFGGGIVNDMGGFLASIFMRGIPVLQIPTTLLAQVDAAIGGKTGVNLVSGKNLIGTFHQPLAVLIDTSVLGTLSDREFRAGMQEIVKAGIIRSAPLFQLLSENSTGVLSRNPDLVDRIVADSVAIKAEVVSADEREGDLRRILNFGHTFGHALEAETAYARFLHGEAVAWGMTAATYLGETTGHVNHQDAVAMRELIDRYGPVPRCRDIPGPNLLRRLASDKKTVQGRVHFVLPRAIGDVTVVSGVEDAKVLAAIESALA